MRDALVLAVLIVGLPLIGWALVQGLRSGTMEAAGVPFASYARSKNPFMFWLATIFNIAVLIGGAAILIAARS
jgi:hypothetical protein